MPNFSNCEISIMVKRVSTIGRCVIWLARMPQHRFIYCFESSVVGIMCNPLPVIFNIDVIEPDPIALIDLKGIEQNPVKKSSL